MLESVQTTLEISASAKKKLITEMSAIAEFSAIPGLLWSRNRDEGLWRWSIGYYDQHIVEGSDFAGYLIYASDLNIIFPKNQHQMFSNLDGMVLDVQDGEFVVKPIL